MDSNIITGTYTFLIIWFLSCILFCVFFARNGKIALKDMFKLIITLVSIAVFCLWIFWLCVYISQLNPMIFPQRKIINE
ncbi:V-type ATPase V0 subunit e, putative [Plasmodium berghei]|uniref:V-type ATPase V0 subunit e, putative n=2 Tax=Plasmodium berghei TaxID=5821 RepID=A0A509AJS7_PLABA|nr:V-type ATPase V0 subunit e, putative [Plasmodium berghei ANKA]SCM19900.1 V-type ATPase V0 subunit e, putative [Plasmodium berghei]SCO59992.1 V-type ATPase V0 subunit e, putative [Plasmodium berghei]VUC54869.1 V-type ATPase V0 subunit e, putative [Plasmodium berghei ANKA]|eukprot:XP_034420694.1 V-type ATPase V0 subunit e, putative [Plasmodium berghei ANKA]